MFKKDSAVDQSQFHEQAPLLQTVQPSGAAAKPALGTAVETAAAAPTDSRAVEKIPFVKSKQFKIVLAGIPLLLVFILFIAVQLRNRQAAPEAPIEAPSTIETGPAVDRSPFQVRLENVKAELEKAEPTSQEFAFPPVDPKLSLEDS